VTTEGNGKLGLIDRLLRYADRPWKVAALIVAVIVLGGGYAVWEQRAAIATRVLESYASPAPKLRVDRFPKIATKLMADTGADWVQLSRASLPSNVYQVVDGKLAGDPGYKPAGGPLPIFSTRTRLDMDEIGKIISGHVICFDVVQYDHLYEAANLDMKRECMTAVPQMLGVFIGFLMVGWKTPPGEISEETYKSELGRQANELATW